MTDPAQSSPGPVVAVLGAGGLVGDGIATGLEAAGRSVVPIARRFTAAQSRFWRARAVSTPIVDLSLEELTRLLDDHRVDVVVNCLGVLQDGPRGGTDQVHRAFVERLVAAIRAAARGTLLVHVSIPGTPTDDTTDFARTKRAADEVICASDLSFAILRPGFVVAPIAYGGSALIRALAALPVGLPAREASRPFAATGIDDLVRTVAVLADRHAAGDRPIRAVWDVMEERPGTVGDVVAAFRDRFGGPSARFALPQWSLALGARIGDLAARIGWAPPIRSTALAEMRRGVAGDPGEWIAALGLDPISLADALRRIPASVQERWFARLYLLKAGLIGGMALFWLISGGVALTVSFGAARSILVDHGLPSALATVVTVVTSLADMAIGLAILRRASCRTGLLAGIGLALAYAAGSVVLTPEMWLDPVGSLVKILPAILAMAAALAVLDDR